MEVKLAAERHNNGKLRWRNIPHFMLKGLVEVGQFGEKKYSTFNFLKGMPVSDVLDALLRHVEKLESPFEADIDAESGKNHAYHIAWNALYIAYLLEHKSEFDDRYKPEISIQAPNIFVSEEDLNALGLRKFKGE
jgi:hypothetical protein